MNGIRISVFTAFIFGTLFFVIGCGVGLFSGKHYRGDNSRDEDIVNSITDRENELRDITETNRKYARELEDLESRFTNGSQLFESIESIIQESKDNEVKRFEQFKKTHSEFREIIAGLADNIEEYSDSIEQINRASKNLEKKYLLFEKHVAALKESLEEKESYENGTYLNGTSP